VFYPDEKNNIKWLMDLKEFKYSFREARQVNNIFHKYLNYSLEEAKSEILGKYEE
jgi:hypothetical protein